MRLTLVFLLSFFIVRAQKDTGLFVPMVSLHLGGQLPGGDLADRFGANLNVGASFLIKSKKNWLVGMEGNYMYGRNVKEDVLSQLKTASGNVIDNEGYPADLRVTERGLGIHLVAGKVLNIWAPNKNSGLMFMVGCGYLQHKINLFDYQKKIAAVKGDLKYGYDRLSNGISTSQFLGYMYLGQNQMINFYFGFEFYQGFTQSVRKLNYDTGLPDTKKRLDLLYGFRFGWILPLYKKKPNEFYYD